MNVIDCIRTHAMAMPDHPAICTDGENQQLDACISYRELVARFEVIAERLRKAGVQPGERCGLLAKQGAGFIEAALGILAADLCFVPIPDGTQGASLKQAIADANLHHLLQETSANESASTPAATFDLQHFRDVDSVDGQADALFRSLTPAYLRFTSGTTHQRKGVILGHDRILERLENANHGLAIAPRDRILWLLPMAHHFIVSILLYLRFGATILLPASSLARAVLEFANRAGATVFYASPYHYGLLAKDASDLTLKSVRLAVSTTDGLRSEIAERFATRFALPLTQALGIIEVGLPVINLKNARAQPTVLGQVQPGYEIWLRDEDGQPICGPSSPERTGEICIRGGGMFSAYLKPWTLAQDLLTPDGFRTGDQGWFDSDGNLHLAGRRKNRINMAGMKFFAEEVEAVLNENPEVALSRVSAKMHPHLGEIPVAEIVAKYPAAPPDRTALAQYCRERLAAYKIPRQFTIVDSLPMTATGKLQRWTDDTN